MRQDGRKLDHETLERIRLEAIARVSAGEVPSEVIASYGFCRTTIYKWLRVTDGARMHPGLLASTVASGRPPRLNRSQEQIVFAAISGKTPADHGLKGYLWTRRLVAEFIERQLHIALGVTAVGNLLTRLVSKRDPYPFRQQEDDAPALRHWRVEVYAPLLRRAKSRGAEILWWCYPQPALAQSVVARSAACINAKGAFWTSHYAGEPTGEKLVQLISAMRQGRTRALYLVLDNLPPHKSPAVKRYVKSTNGLLEVYLLPAKRRPSDRRK